MTLFLWRTAIPIPGTPHRSMARLIVERSSPSSSLADWTTAERDRNITRKDLTTTIVVCLFVCVLLWECCVAVVFVFVFVDERIRNEMQVTTTLLYFCFSSQKSY